MADRLNDFERDVMLPLVVRLLTEANGRVLSSFQIAEYVRKNGYKSCNSYTVRKVVNHIRRYAIIPCLASNGKGYFVASNDREISETIYSLEGRIDAIQEVIEALKEQRYIKYNI